MSSRFLLGAIVGGIAVYVWAIRPARLTRDRR